MILKCSKPAYQKKKSEIHGIQTKEDLVRRGQKMRSKCGMENGLRPTFLFGLGRENIPAKEFQILKGWAVNEWLNTDGLAVQGQEDKQNPKR